jgi:hypothetical protein
MNSKSAAIVNDESAALLSLLETLGREAFMVALERQYAHIRRQHA